MLKFLLTRQYDNESMHKYMTWFKANSKAVKMISRNLTLFYELIMGLEYKNIFSTDIVEKYRDSAVKLVTKAFEGVFNGS